MKKHLLILSILFASTVFAQTPYEMHGYLGAAAAEFNVPQPVLEAIAYVQSRWHQITFTERELVSRPSDVQPPAFGVMGLRNDYWFGHSLTDAATLLNEPALLLRDSAYENIRGAAALLSKYRDDANRDSISVTSDPASWSGVIARFSGIPQKEIAQEFAYHVLQVLQKGINESGIVIPPQNVNLNNFPESVKEKGYVTKKELPSAVTAGADYPGATWNPSQNYGNRNSAPVVFVIIHDTEGPFDYSVSWLQNPAAQASSHYIIRSQDGYIEQLVHDADMAWAVRCWNPITLSIEHEGYVADSSYFTETMYEASAHLTQYLCDKFNIPEDSLHIFGHDAWTYSWFNLIPFYLYTGYVGGSYATCNTHTDPGQFWKWHHYFDLIHSYDTTRPAVADASPASGSGKVPAYATPSITFNVPMDPQSVDSALTATPSFPGVPTLNQNGTLLTFQHPDSLLPWSTTYTINVDTLARAANGKRLTSRFTYQFTTAPLDTTGPALLAASPRSGGPSLPNAYVEFVMDEPVQPNSLPTRITLTDSTGKSVGFTKDLLTVTTNNLTLIALRSTSPLTRGMRYTASLAEGLTDYYGNASKILYSTTFTVDTSVTPKGTVIEGFENTSNGWLQPAASSLTTGTDTSLSFFSPSGKSYEGTYAASLQYSLDSASAFCAFENAEGFDTSPSDSVGAWVFGDNSANELDFIFGSSTRKAVPVDTLDWYGWKYVGMWRSKSDASTGFLRGFGVRRLQSALFSASTIYIDDIRANGSVTGTGGNVAGVPSSFELFQNYPNPFNPTTVISYQLSAVSRVTLKVYDVLGREVATLVNDTQNPGTYSVNFNATGLPSGTYFYRITGGSNSPVMKMLILK